MYKKKIFFLLKSKNFNCLKYNKSQWDCLQTVYAKTLLDTAHSALERECL